MRELKVIIVSFAFAVDVTTNCRRMNINVKFILYTFLYLVFCSFPACPAFLALFLLFYACISLKLAHALDA